MQIMDTLLYSPLGFLNVILLLRTCMCFPINSGSEEVSTSFNTVHNSESKFLFHTVWVSCQPGSAYSYSDSCL